MSDYVYITHHQLYDDADIYFLHDQTGYTDKEIEICFKLFDIDYRAACKRDYISFNDCSGLFESLLTLIRYSWNNLTVAEEMSFPDCKYKKIIYIDNIACVKNRDVFIKHEEFFYKILDDLISSEQNPIPNYWKTVKYMFKNNLHKIYVEDANYIKYLELSQSISPEGSDL